MSIGSYQLNTITLQRKPLEIVGWVGALSNYVYARSLNLPTMSWGIPSPKQKITDASTIPVEFQIWEVETKKYSNTQRINVQTYIQHHSTF